MISIIIHTGIEVWLNLAMRHNHFYNRTICKLLLFLPRAIIVFVGIDLFHGNDSVAVIFGFYSPFSHNSSSYDVSLYFLILNSFNNCTFMLWIICCYKRKIHPISCFFPPSQIPKNPHTHTNTCSFRLKENASKINRNARILVTVECSVKKEKKKKSQTLWQVESAPKSLILTFKANVTQFRNCFQFFELRNVYTKLVWQYVKLEQLVKWFLFGWNWYPYLLRKKEEIESTKLHEHELRITFHARIFVHFWCNWT